jgi:hypothetical protein
MTMKHPFAWRLGALAVAFASAAGCSPDPGSAPGQTIRSSALAGSGAPAAAAPAVLWPEYPGRDETERWRSRAILSWTHDNAPDRLGAHTARFRDLKIEIESTAKRPVLCGAVRTPRSSWRRFTVFPLGSSDAPNYIWNADPKSVGEFCDQRATSTIGVYPVAPSVFAGYGPTPPGGEFLTCVIRMKTTEIAAEYLIDVRGRSARSSPAADGPDGKSWPISSVTPTKIIWTGSMPILGQFEYDRRPKTVTLIDHSDPANAVVARCE